MSDESAAGPTGAASASAPTVSREELLRRVYGAASTEAERAEAVDALERLDAAEVARTTHAEAASARDDDIARNRHRRDMSDVARTDDLAPGRVRREGLRNGAPIVAAALVAGSLLGWTAARLDERPAATSADVTPAPTEGGAVNYFLESGTAGDVLLAPLDPEDPLRQSTLEVLWTDAANDVRTYTALTESDAICLIGVASGAVAQTCTGEPVLPEEGLTIELPVENDFGELRITWLPGGTVQIDDGFQVRVAPP